MESYPTTKRRSSLKIAASAALLTIVCALPSGARAQSDAPAGLQGRTAQVLRIAAEQKRILNALQLDATAVAETWGACRQGDGEAEMPCVSRERARLSCGGQKMRWTVESRHPAGDTSAAGMDGGVSPLSFGYQVDGKWLVDLLREGRVQWQGTVNHFKYGQLQVVRCQADNEQATVLWLSPVNGLIVRAEKHGDVRTVYQAASIKEFAPGVWLATSGLCYRKQEQAESLVVDTKRTFTFRSVRLSRASHGAIEATCKPGDVLFDENQGKTLLRTASGWRPLPRQSLSSPSRLENNLVALSWLTGVVLGVCGPGCWYRRRQMRLAR